MSSKTEDQLTLRFFEPAHPEVQRTAATALVQSLDALQRIILLLAMRREGRAPGRRIRPSAELQSRYRLVCELPRAGSYMTPVHIEGTGLLAPAEAAAVMAELQKILEAVGNQEEAAFATALPDETWRRYVLEALERLPPPRIIGVELEVLRKDTPLVDTVKARPFLERLARTPSRKAVRGSIVGEFKRIDFARREITIRHIGTSRDIQCVYEDHVEESLLDHPRDVLLVLGTVTRDTDGRPISIEDVEHIEPINLGAIDISEVIAGNVTIAPKEPISAAVSFDETDVVYQAENSELGVAVFAESRDMLEAAVQDELSLLWKRYAKASDEKLTPAAQTLKRRILAAFAEVIDAA